MLCPSTAHSSIRPPQSHPSLLKTDRNYNTGITEVVVYVYRRLVETFGGLTELHHVMSE